MPDDAQFWDKSAARYAKYPIKDMAAYEHKLAKTREYFTPESTVLELGCGTGSTALKHAPYVKHYRATDLSPRMIEIARSKLKQENISNLSFEAGEILDLKIPEPVDAILAHSLLHLVEDREAVIAQVYKWLKPGGVFITSTVCLGDKMKFFKLIAPIGKLFGLMPTLRVFTTRDLKQSLTENGFDIDYEWKPEGDKFAAVFIVARKPETNRAG